MDELHGWVLLRLLVIALITLPFVVAAVVAGFRQRRPDAVNAASQSDDRSVPPAIAGPSAWRVKSDGRSIEKRAA